MYYYTYETNIGLPQVTTGFNTIVYFWMIWGSPTHATSAPQQARVLSLELDADAARIGYDGGAPVRNR